MSILQLPRDVLLRAIISDLAYACHTDEGVEGKKSGDRAETKLNWHIQRAIAEGNTQLAKDLKNCQIAKDYCNQNTVPVVYINRDERTGRETREVIIGCRGSILKPTWSGIVGDFIGNNISIALNSVPGRRPLTTLKHVKEVMNAFGPGYQFSVTGHSLGGSVAECVSRWLGIRGDGFNGGSGLKSRDTIVARVSIIK